MEKWQASLVSNAFPRKTSKPAPFITFGAFTKEYIMAANRIKMIKKVLEETFSPVEIEVLDESHKHVGHLGARSGKGHFKLTIIS